MSAVLSGRTVVVTGGAGRLGSKFCSAIVEHGGTAIVADVNQTQAEEVVLRLDEIRKGGAFAVAIDITDAQSIHDAIRNVNERAGPIHALVNNAYPRNANYGRRLEEVTYEDFCDNLGMHLGGYFLASQKFAELFAATGGGAIVNISSIYGVIAPRFEVYAGTSMTMPVEYAAIKAGVIHLTKYFAQYFKKSGVRVNAISPGGILDRQPSDFLAAYAEHCGQKGMLNPDDVAGALVYLLSDSAAAVTGQNIVIDDGFSL